MSTTLLAPGGRLDESAAVTPVRIAVLTISDTRDEESDTSGHILVGRLADAGHTLADKDIVPDDIEAIRARVRSWVASGEDALGAIRRELRRRVALPERGSAGYLRVILAAPEKLIGLFSPRRA